MKLSIELVKEETVLQEPVWVRLRFKSNSGSVFVPVDYDSADVVQLMLLDGDGEMLSYGDSYIQSTRLGLTPERVSQSDMETAKLGKGKSLEWTEDLLAYVDIDSPGDYFVQARFHFQPSGIDVISEKAALKIHKNDCRWMAFHRDQVAIGMTYGIQQHVMDGDVRTFYHIRNDSNPITHWKSGEINAPANARPRISEADFVSLDTFDHDFQRWVAWREERTIRLTRFIDIHPDKKIYKHTLDYDVEALIGNPFQHEDGSVSVLLTNKPKQKAIELHKIDFDTKGKTSRDDVIARFSDPPAPISCSTKYDETLFLVSANNGSLPVKLMTYSDQDGAKWRTILTLDQYKEISRDSSDIRSVQVLSAFPLVKAFSSTSPAVLLSIVVEQSKSPKFCMTRIPLDDDGEPAEPIRIVESSLPADLLKKSESIDYADVADAPAGKLHGIFTTTEGRIFGFTENQSFSLLAETEPEKTHLVQLITALNESVYLLYPTGEKGIQHVTIQSAQTP